MAQENHPKVKQKHTLWTFIFIPVNYTIRKILFYLRKWSKAEMTRTMKPEYFPLIEGLDPEKAYFPESISESLSGKEQGRCCGVLKKFKMYNEFPPSGDTTIVTPKGTIPAWYGKRWQESLQLLLDKG